MELLCHWVGINPALISRKEIFLLEVELFARFCDELKEIFRKQYKNYFHLMKVDKEKENIMVDNMLVCLVIKDILSTEEYNIEGIACYTDIPEDVILDVVDGRNANPSAKLLRRSIDLHRSVRRDLYRSIIQKIATDLTVV